MLWWRSSRTVLIVSTRDLDERVDVPFLRQPQIRLLNGFPDDESMRVASNERPRLIIDEIAEGDRAGVDFCRRLRADPGTCAIPLILLAEPPMHDDASTVRADELLDAPLAPGELFEAVRRYVPLPKRSHDRIRLNLRFTFTRNGKTGQAFSRDLSSRGAYIKTDHPVPVGSTVALATFCRESVPRWF